MAPQEAEDDEDYPSYIRVVLEFYGYTSRCWNNQVSEYIYTTFMECGV